jgi:hypothetical protein
MFKQLSKWVTGAAVAAILLISPLALLQPAQAVNTTNDLWGGAGNAEKVQSNTGLGNNDPRLIMASVIKIFLGFLGIIAVVLILLAGFKYMRAGGESGEAEEAMNQLKAAVIGLIIILAAYGIANFILNSVLTATTQQ